MVKDYSVEVKKLINKHKKEGLIFGKDIDFLIKRIKVSKQEIEKEILECKNLVLTEKQVKGEEIRYALFFTYT